MTNETEATIERYEDDLRILAVNVRKLELDKTTLAQEDESILSDFLDVAKGHLLKSTTKLHEGEKFWREDSKLDLTDEFQTITDLSKQTEQWTDYIMLREKLVKQSKGVAPAP